MEELLSIDIDENIKKEAIAISSRYEKLNQQNRLGVLSSEQYNLTGNQITNQLIDLINFPKNQINERHDLTGKLKPSNPQKEKKNISYWIGIIGGIASIFGLLFYFLPILEVQAPQLTVYVTDDKGNVPLEHVGEVNISIGNRPMRETIGEHGRTNFGDILPRYIGDTITVGFKAKGWEVINGNNTFIFSGEPIYLKVKKDDSLGTIKGVIKTRDGQEFIKEAQVMINSDTVVFTKENGVFKVILPEKMRVKQMGEGYKLTISKEGYKTKTEYYYTKSSDAEIRLEKLK